MESVCCHVCDRQRPTTHPVRKEIYGGRGDGWDIRLLCIRRHRPASEGDTCVEGEDVSSDECETSALPPLPPFQTNTKNGR